jgi:hypothetical protein
MIRNCTRFLLSIICLMLFSGGGFIYAGHGKDSAIRSHDNSFHQYSSKAGIGSDDPMEQLNTQYQKDKKQTFIINTCITDLNEFRKLVKSASRLKKYGIVQINIGTVADKAFYEIPEGGNPWSEYASNLAALYKFFPDEKIAPFVPAEFVSKNRQLLLDKAKILRENGMEAAFFANEPAFFPSAFFDAYPQLRGPRVDHPRRSNVAFFSPCLSLKETQDIYTNMMAELLKNAPEVKTFYFKTNDAGSGNCWSDWLYTGPNGSDHCKGETTGMRIQELMSSLQAGAAKAKSNLDIYLSFPQGSSNFSDEERTDIQNRLPENCYFKSTPDHEMKTISTDIVSLYPVSGICDVLSLLNGLKIFDNKKQQTVFISFNVFYNRGNECADTEDLILSIIEDHLENIVNVIPVSQKLRKLCESWAGVKYADSLSDALSLLNEAFKFRRSYLGNLYGINWNIAARMINRPLVAAPQRLSKEEEAYFLPYVFNVSREEARMDYIDIQGGRWTTLPDSVKTYVKKIKQVCIKLEAIGASAPKNDFIHKMSIALRVHASLVRSCGNFAEAQQIRDNNKEKLNGPVHRPGKEGTWTGDTDLLKFNTIMRDELDNTVELTEILQQRGIDVLWLAKDNAHEDCFLLGPDIIVQLKMKRKIMLNHWRDIEDYMTTPFK